MVYIQTQVPWVPCGMSTLVDDWSERGSLFSFDLIFWLGSGWVFPEVKYKNFVMFQCMACACFRIWGDPGNQFLWSPWSVLPA